MAQLLFCPLLQSACHLRRCRSIYLPAYRSRRLSIHSSTISIPSGTNKRYTSMQYEAQYLQNAIRLHVILYIYTYLGIWSYVSSIALSTRPCTLHDAYCIFYIMYIYIYIYMHIVVHIFTHAKHLEAVHAVPWTAAGCCCEIKDPSHHFPNQQWTPGAGHGRTF